MDDDSSDLGYLARYGAMIVPPSNRADAGWLVTLTEWKQEAETYAASMDGPMFETQEEALEEVGKLLEWIAQKGERDDLMQIWEQMQRDMTRDRLETPDARTLGRWW